MADGEAPGVAHECHEGRCTHKKVCSEVVSSMGSELRATQAARGVGRGGPPWGLYGQVAATLTWKELSVTVSNLKGKRRTVLFNATGYAEPGKLMAIMGPSGSGKSTLLDALAGTPTHTRSHRHTPRPRPAPALHLSPSQNSTLPHD